MQNIKNGSGIWAVGGGDVGGTTSLIKWFHSAAVE